MPTRTLLILGHPSPDSFNAALADAYADAARQAGRELRRIDLHALKFEGRRSLAPRLGALVLERCAPVLDAADALVPVPLHPRREWTRGFNQADLIARELGVPVWRPLRRTRHTSSQSALAAAERWRNVAGAFALRRRFHRRGGQSALNGTCVVLVDDVQTTGATLEACAEVLLHAGVQQVRAVTVARAVLAYPTSPT